MKLLEEGNYKSDWTMNATCTGKGWDQKNPPCFSKYLIESNDILKRRYTDMGGDSETFYGFVCPKCHCFTEIAIVPYDVQTFAQDYLEYAKNNAH